MKTRIFQLCLIAAILWGLVSCAPPVVPRAIIPTMPPKSASVSPVVDTARSASAKTAVASDRLERQVEALKQTASQLNDGMADAVLEADRLRKQKTATEAELEALWKQLTKIHERNLFLEIQADEAVKYAVDQRTLRLEAEASLVEVSRIAADRDAEVNVLRLQHNDMALTITEQAAAYDLQSKALTKANRDAGIGQAVRGGFWTVLIMGGIALIIFFAIKAFARTASFP